MAKGFKVLNNTLQEINNNDGYIAHFFNQERNALRVVHNNFQLGIVTSNVAANKLIDDHKATIIRGKNKLRGKKIVFCLPGRSVSYAFLKNFVQLCFDLAANQTGFTIQQDYSSMVNFARCKCLGYHVSRGKHQLPWDGQLEYDYQLWIDSDIIFNSALFWKLADTAIFDSPQDDNRSEEEYPLKNKSDDELDQIGRWEESVRKERAARLNLVCNPITSGYYATEDRHNVTVAHWITDSEEFVRNNGMMRTETIESMAARTKPFTCDYVGFGFVMIANGVFENMTYPVFGPKLQTFDNGIQDYCGEDVGFCLDAKELGISILVDPSIRVGHEKMVVL